MNIDAQSSYWDSQIAKEFTAPLDLGILEKYLAHQSVIVDVGCGYGRVCDELANNGYINVKGFDISAAMVNKGRRCGLNLELMEHGRIPLDDESVDGALLFSVLTCIPTDDGQRRLMDEIIRILRPGGYVFISDFPIQSHTRCVERYEKYAERYSIYGVFELPDGAILRHMSMATLHERVAAFNFCDEWTEDIKSMRGNPIRAWRFIGQKPLCDKS
ncbi:MAG TPA: class I SAM-dependent methyltransferase [Phycisphaerae bacterium]|nr:class I SAM-dependent methyltransferase [Phycisphaerae bacterium]HPS52184.1 class I SAM-dependent methyltransferase [Phycisphaerae bacterium]